MNSGKTIISFNWINLINRHRRFDRLLKCSCEVLYCIWFYSELKLLEDFGRELIGNSNYVHLFLVPNIEKNRSFNLENDHWPILVRRYHECTSDNERKVQKRMQKLKCIPISIGNSQFQLKFSLIGHTESAKLHEIQPTKFGVVVFRFNWRIFFWFFQKKLNFR